MAEKNHIAEVRLRRIEFATKGASGQKARTEHTLASTLHWPRYGTQSKTVARPVEMDGMSRDYGPEDWADAILFKESIQPPSAVTFQLSVPLASDALAKALGAILKAGLTVAGDFAESLMPSKGLGKIASAPFDAFATAATNRAEGVLGQGTLLLDEALLEKECEVEVELRAPRNIVKTSAATRRNGYTPREKKLVAKGDVTARLFLVLTPR